MARYPRSYPHAQNPIDDRTARLVTWDERTVGTLLISLQLALVANSLRPGQEKHTMSELQG